MGTLWADHLSHLQVLPDLSYYQLRPKLPTSVSFLMRGTAGHGSTHCQAVLAPTVPAGSPPSPSTARRSSGSWDDSVLLRRDWLGMPCRFHLHGLVGCGHLSHACWFVNLLPVCAHLLLFLTELNVPTGSLWVLPPLHTGHTLASCTLTARPPSTVGMSVNPEVHFVTSSSRSVLLLS